MTVTVVTETMNRTTEQLKVVAERLRDGQTVALVVGGERRECARNWT